MMLSGFRGEIGHKLVPDRESLERNNAYVLVTQLPRLTLLQFHWGTVRGSFGHGKSSLETPVSTCQYNRANCIQKYL
jgi:hypothetical protein